MNTAKALWIIASLYLIVVGFIYIIVLKTAPAEGAERLSFIQANWAYYGHQWKAEFLIAVSLSISAFIFAQKLGNTSFYLVAVGQGISSVAFPISLGLVPEVPYEIYKLSGEAMHFLNNSGMMISLLGFFLIHWSNGFFKPGLRMAALLLSGLAFLVFLAGFMEILTTQQTQKGMPLVLLLYLINAFYGFKLRD